MSGCGKPGEAKRELATLFLFTPNYHKNENNAHLPKHFLTPLFALSQQKEIEIDKLTGDTTFSIPDMYIVGKRATIAPKPSFAFDIEQKKQDLTLILWGSEPGGVLNN